MRNNTLRQSVFLGLLVLSLLASCQPGYIERNNPYFLRDSVRTGVFTQDGAKIVIGPDGIQQHEIFTNPERSLY